MTKRFSPLKAAFIAAVGTFGMAVSGCSLTATGGTIGGLAGYGVRGDSQGAALGAAIGMGVGLLGDIYSQQQRQPAPYPRGGHYEYRGGPVESCHKYPQPYYDRYGQRQTRYTTHCYER